MDLKEATQTVRTWIMSSRNEDQLNLCASFIENTLIPKFEMEGERYEVLNEAANDLFYAIAERTRQLKTIKT